MKIAWITNNINQLGGIEKVICSLSSVFTTQFGYAVEIFSINSFEDHFFFPLHESVQVHHCKLGWREETFGRLVKLTRSILRNLDADVVLTCHPTISYAVVLNKWNFKGKIIVTQHNTNDYFRKIKLRLNACLFCFADKFVVLTKKDQKGYAQMGCNAEVIPNACYNAAATSAHLKNKQILGVGRIEHIKGFDRLIDAFATISPKHPEWKLCICGNGTAQEALQRQAEQLNISEKVIFPGAVKDMDSYYRNASVFALSSRNEGFPLVLVEAMSHGLPVVSFEIPSVQDIFAEGDCLIAPQGDMKKFTECLDLLLSDEELRTHLGQRSRELSNEYTPISIAKQWIRLFEDIVVNTESV